MPNVNGKKYPYTTEGRRAAKKASTRDYPKTWHPGTPKEQSAAQRQIAANKRAAAKRAESKRPSRTSAATKRPGGGRGPVTGAGAGVSYGKRGTPGTKRAAMANRTQRRPGRMY
jgi:hypothetical protein